MKTADGIIPAILSQTPEDFQNDLAKLTNSQSLNKGWVHVDFMDNLFVPNFSIKPQDLKKADFRLLKKEAHLMVKKPESWIRQLINLGFGRIVIHVEAEGDIAKYLSLIKKSGKDAGLAINPPTPVNKLAPFVQMIDMILVMGVIPGFQGQAFIPETTDKIRDIRAKDWPVKIEVDGSVKDWNAKEIIESGADSLVLGSFLIKGDPDQNMAALLKALG